MLSILAAIVASQAMITGSFQLISQTMSLSYFPKVKLVRTSDKFHGQLYIPLANWLMMIGTVIVTAVYNNVSFSVAVLRVILHMPRPDPDPGRRRVWETRMGYA